MDHERLALIDFRHLAFQLKEALFQSFGEGRVKNQLAVQRLSRGFARQIVLGGAEAAGNNQDAGSGKRAPDGIGKPLAVVADHGLGDHFHSQVVQLGGEVKGIGIDALRRQHFGADRDNLRVHQISSRPLMPASTRYKALVVATIMAREGVNARPTMPGPERNSSACLSESMRTTPLRPAMEAAT